MPGLLVGEKIPMAFQADDGATNKFVKAIVKGGSGTEIAGSPFTLAHHANGLYRNIAVDMPNTAHLMVQMQAFTDSGFTTPADYAIVTEVFTRTPEPGDSGGGGGGGGFDPGSFQNILARVGCVGEEAEHVGGQVEIVPGADKTLRIRVVDKNTGEPFSLENWDDLKVRFKKTDNTILTKTDDTDPDPVEIEGVEELGIILCPLNDTESALLKPTERGDIEIEIVRGTTTIIIPVIGCLRVPKRAFT